MSRWNHNHAADDTSRFYPDINYPGVEVFSAGRLAYNILEILSAGLPTLSRHPKHATCLHYSLCQHSREIKINKKTTDSKSVVRTHEGAYVSRRESDEGGRRLTGPLRRLAALPAWRFCSAAWAYRPWRRRSADAPPTNQRARRESGEGKNQKLCVHAAHASTREHACAGFTPCDHA